MFTEERDKWDVLFGVVVAAILVGGVYLASRYATEQDVPKPTAVSPAAAQPQIIFSTSTVERSSAASPAAIAAVYECWRGEQRILSDQPCGADASLRQVVEPNRMNAQDTRSLYSPVYVSSRRSGGASSAGQGANASDLCDSIQDQIDRINARMRHAYTSQEGERFRERLRALSLERYEAKCIR